MSDHAAVKLPQPVFIVSDGTGDTAEKVVRAAFRQFRGHLVHLRTFGQATRPEMITALVRRAQRSKAMIVTTLVQKEMREHVRRVAREHGVRHIDLLGGLIDELEAFLDQAPVGVPGLLRTADESYFRRIEAVEFTVKADDGKEPRMLKEADVVLVGVSRTSKTPLSTFLAHKGYKVGNVPLVLDREPPAELFQIDPRRVFALFIDPHALQRIRRARLKAMGMPDATNYGDINYILAELEFAEALYKRNPLWPVMDVTTKALEESAATILQILQERGLAAPPGEVSQL